MTRHLFVVAALLAACSLPLRAQRVPDSVSPAQAEAFEPAEARPGRSTRVPRRWEGQPPLVPHSVRGLVPITPKANACIRCHGRAGARAGPPPAPASHFVDLRQAPHEVREGVAASRYVCTACHVTQTAAPPFIESTFEPPSGRVP